MKNINETRKVLLLFADSAVRKGLADADLLKQILQDASDEQGARLEFYVAKARNLSFFVSKDDARIYDHKNKRDLKDYDFVYFRKAGAVMQQMLSCAVYLKSHHIPYYDREIGETNPRNKLSQMFMLQAKGLPVPTTLFCRNRKRAQRLLRTTYADRFKYPVIAKATGGTRGDANFLVRTPEGLGELLGENKRHFLIQSFIPNDGDFRALVVGDKLRGLIKRKGEEGSHLNNTSQGGSAAWLPLETFNTDLQILSVRAAQICKRDIAGVDVLLDKETNQPYILEVNRAPQIENASYPTEKATVLVEGIAEAIDEHVPVHRTDGKQTIGRKEHVKVAEIPELGEFAAKVDTGAYSNTLHCEYIEEVVDERGHKVLQYSPFADKRTIHSTENYFVKRVVSSNGIAEDRFIVELHHIIGGQELVGQVSLTNRGTMNYPMLIGRKFLKQHGLAVDVSKRFSL